MPRTASQPVDLLDGPFRGSLAISRGLLTPDQLRSAVWRQLFRDVYAHRDLPVTHQFRAIAVASLLIPAAVITGCSAATLWGIDLAGPEDDVEVTVRSGEHPRRIRGVRVRRAWLPDAVVLRRRGVLTTTLEAAAVRAAAALPFDDAVVAVDRLTASCLVDIEPIRVMASSSTGPGSAKARKVCAAADGRAESPQETRLRLLMRRAGLPAPVAQFVVKVDGRFVARVDFAWPDLKLAVEYDGLWHAEGGQFARDRQRLNRLHAAGWRVVFVTAADMHAPEALVARIAAALAR